MTPNENLIILLKAQNVSRQSFESRSVIQYGASPPQRQSLLIVGTKTKPVNTLHGALY
jgi:hypothetical protein